MRKTLINAFFQYNLLASAVLFFWYLLLVTGQVDKASGVALRDAGEQLAFALSLLALPLAMASAGVPRRFYWPIIVSDILILTLMVPLIFDNKMELASFYGHGLSLLVALDNLRARRRATGHTWGLLQDVGALSRWRFALALPALPALYLCLVVGFTGAGIVRMLNEKTGGQVEVNWDGIYLKQSVYQRGDQEVYLVSMIHVGDKDFFEALVNEFPIDDTVILAEGVSDKNNLLEGLDYKNVAKAVGKESQVTHFNEALDAHRVVNADIDVSDLEPATIEVLKKTSDIVEGSFSLSSLRGLSSSAPKNFEDQLIRTRNERLMKVFDREAPKYGTVIIPWGAMHNADIAARLKARGFTLVREKARKGSAFFDKVNGV